MDNNERFKFLFQQYFDKKCTQAEKAELFDMFRHAEHDEALRHLIEETWDKDLPRYGQSGKAARRMLDRILHRDKAAGQRYFNIKRNRAIRYAAAAALFGVIAAIWLSHRPHAKPQQIDTIAQATPAQGDKYLTLPDGSKVLLHKNAHIDYPAVFEGSNREVYLKGEAYFDIKAGQAPFIVHTGNIRTTVLGTAFNIDEQDKHIIVTVTRGKVKVENDRGDFSILKRDEQAMVDIRDNRITKVQVDANAIIAWKKPYILFNDVTMREAADELERRFNVTITLDNSSLENCNVTASFMAQESLEQIMRILTKINNMDYKFIDSSKIIVTGEGCR